MARLEGTPAKAPGAELQPDRGDRFSEQNVSAAGMNIEDLRAGRGFEVAQARTKNPTMADLTRIGQQVNQQMASQDIGGRGWTGNFQDDQKCGEVNYKAAEALREKLAQAGFTNVRVGQVMSENGNMLMGNGAHSIAVMYDPASGKGVIVDAWQNPRRVVPVNVQVNSSSGLSSEISVNFPKGTGGYRPNGYHGGVTDVNMRRD